MKKDTSVPLFFILEKLFPLTYTHRDIDKMYRRRYAATSTRATAFQAPTYRKRTATTRRRPARRAATTARRPANRAAAQGGSLGRTLLSTGGGLLGGALGSALGSPSIGATVGRAIGDGAATILGMGAYEIKENSLLTSPTVPVMHDVGNSVRIKHREYIGDVVSSGTANTFKCVQYHLNPGLSSTFPWLSSIANAFEQYELMGYAIEYKSASGDALNSVNTALGSILMAANYRASAPAFTDKQQMLNSQWAVECKPSVNALLPIECAKGENPFSVMYVRSGEVDAGEDIKMFDPCTINIASSGMQGTNVVLGEIWATYDILLKKPISEQVAGFTLKSAHYESVPPTRPAATNAAPLTGMSEHGDEIGLAILNGDTIRFPANSAGKYLITFYIEGDLTQVFAPTIVPTNATLLTIFATESSFDNTGMVSTSLIMQFAVEVGTTDPTHVADVTFTTTTIPTTPQYNCITVAQVNPDIF